tara:strand:- start:22 stop:633 length:612 start_codon:yes stop_codon:yes gene_type:complete
MTRENIVQPEFGGFPKMARLSREVLITEKIDGTNSQILITEGGGFFTGSRNRWITPQDDNFGFSAWAYDNKEDLMKLGAGRHFGEWWGQGIQRKYGLSEQRFSLFNVARWHLAGEEPQVIPSADPRIIKHTEELPKCCHLVPLLCRGVFSTGSADACLDELKQFGSVAAPGFMKPEGLILFHIAGNVGFKKTIIDDELPKGAK